MLITIALQIRRTQFALTGDTMHTYTEYTESDAEISSWKII